MTQRHLWSMAVFLTVPFLFSCSGEPDISVPGEANEPVRTQFPDSKPTGPQPPLAEAPFDADRATQHQQAWATYLNVPAKYTNSVGMTLTLIPAGEFVMGSPDSSRGTFGDEKPEHKVRIKEPFYLGVHEVTQEQYETVTGENPSGFEGASNPVEQVSWNDAVEFCTRLSAKEGQTYRLPTEAEWEYACRAGNTTLYSSGDALASLDEFAWHLGNSHGRTHQVGEKEPNAWGIHDMNGNVLEWCADWYDRGYYAVSPIDDPSGPEAGTERVLRGGSWRDDGWNNATFRFKFEPWSQGIVMGFRVVAELPREPSREPSEHAEPQDG